MAIRLKFLVSFVFFSEMDNSLVASAIKDFKSVNMIKT